MSSSISPQAPLPDRQAAVERSALFVTTLTSFMGPFMISSVNVALPAIQQDFGMNAVELSWVATSYLLAMAVGLLPAGKIADIYGRKKIFTTGLLIYTLSATLAALTDSIGIFIFLRVIQGLGASLYVPTGMAIVTSIFPPERRGRAIGIYVAAVYVGLSVGPFVGGFLTQHLGWHSVFALMLPLGAITILLTRLFLAGEWADARDPKLDIAGCLIYGGAIFSLVYGASVLPSVTGRVLMAVGALGLGVFFFHQSRARHPVFDVSLFMGNKTFAFSSLAALLNYSATYALTFMMSLYLQYIKGMTPQNAGTLLMVQPVIMAAFSPFVGRLSDRIQPRFLSTFGMALTVLGMAIFTQLAVDTSFSLIFATLVVFGFGFAFFSSPNTSAILGAVDKKDYGIASGVVSIMRLMGQMTSMAIATVALSLLVGQRAIEPQTYDRFLLSVRTVFTLSAILCAVGIFFSMFRGKLK
ncbi:MFS transporter [Desulfosarcina sp. OttesenSCG-928-G10]|nr:MFS transporter [Desulfosarcina sp. OttesenSCG-928-G10]MDL2320835.1 MFS transporter [Desulfosarcina sp. OttesenSCG-928-B08]